MRFRVMSYATRSRLLIMSRMVRALSMRTRSSADRCPVSSRLKETTPCDQIPPVCPNITRVAFSWVPLMEVVRRQERRERAVSPMVHARSLKNSSAATGTAPTKETARPAIRIPVSRHQPNRRRGAGSSRASRALSKLIMLGGSQDNAVSYVEYGVRGSVSFPASGWGAGERPSQEDLMARVREMEIGLVLLAALSGPARATDLCGDVSGVWSLQDSPFH